MQAVSDHIASLSELNDLAETLSLYAQMDRRQNRKPKIAKWWQDFLDNNGAEEELESKEEELALLTA